jgi:hypothetical protein
MPELSLDDIKDWQQFEELIAAYFRCLSGIPEANIISIIVQPPGVGQDGGKDMIVEFTIPDLIKAV